MNYSTFPAGSWSFTWRRRSSRRRCVRTTWRTWSSSTLRVTWTCCVASKACRPGRTRTRRSQLSLHRTLSLWSVFGRLSPGRKDAALTLFCVSACVQLFVCIRCVCFPHRLDGIVGPRALSSRAKTFSSSSLHVYDSQGRKNSSQGSEPPPPLSHPSLFTSHEYSVLTQSIQGRTIACFLKSVSRLIISL